MVWGRILVILELYIWILHSQKCMFWSNASVHLSAALYDYVSVCVWVNSVVCNSRKNLTFDFCGIHFSLFTLLYVFLLFFFLPHCPVSLLLGVKRWDVRFPLFSFPSRCLADPPASAPSWDNEPYPAPPPFHSWGLTHGFQFQIGESSAVLIRWNSMWVLSLCHCLICATVTCRWRQQPTICRLFIQVMK